jgi:hypothetical protein
MHFGVKKDMFLTSKRRLFSHSRALFIIKSKFDVCQNVNFKDFFGWNVKKIHIEMQSQFNRNVTNALQFSCNSSNAPQFE